MAGIAREAGYTPPTLYSYFRGKQDIFHALSESVRADLSALFDAPEPSGLNFRQRIELLLTRQLGLVDRRRDAFVFFLSVLMTGDGPPARQEDRHAYEHRMTAWIRAAIEDSGDRPAEPPDVIARMLHGLGHAFLEDWLTRHPDGSAVELAPLLTRLLFHGCSGEPAPQSSQAPS